MGAALEGVVALHRACLRRRSPPPAPSGRCGRSRRRSRSRRRGGTGPPTSPRRRASIRVTPGTASAAASAASATACSASGPGIGSGSTRSSARGVPVPGEHRRIGQPAERDPPGASRAIATARSAIAAIVSGRVSLAETQAWRRPTAHAARGRRPRTARHARARRSGPRSTGCRRRPRRRRRHRRRRRGRPRPAARRAPRGRRSSPGLAIGWAAAVGTERDMAAPDRGFARYLGAFPARNNRRHAGRAALAFAVAPPALALAIRGASTLGKPMRLREGAHGPAHRQVRDAHRRQPRHRRGGGRGAGGRGRGAAAAGALGGGDHGAGDAAAPRRRARSRR